jgi:hypothetical protein
VAEGDLIVAGNALHVALRNRREEGHDQAEDQRAGKDQPTPSKPATVRITPIMHAM